MNVEWKVEDLNTTDKHGRRLVRVWELAEGHEDRHFDVPGQVYLAFVRARQDVVRRKMKDLGYEQKPSIDWSFLEKGTKQ